MLHHFGVLEPARRSSSGADSAQTPFFGDRPDSPTRAEREVELLRGALPFTLMPATEEGASRPSRFVSLFVPPGS